MPDFDPGYDRPLPGRERQQGDFGCGTVLFTLVMLGCVVYAVVKVAFF